jgi:hypothetical protein
MSETEPNWRFVVRMLPPLVAPRPHLSRHEGDRELLLAAGFDGYLEKPISVLEFPEQVRSFVRTGDDA